MDQPKPVIPYQVSKYGKVSVKSADILNSPQGKAQIESLKKIQK